MASRGTLYQGRIVSIGYEKAVYPDGREVPMEVVHHPGGAAAVAIDRDHRVCLLKQYRHVAADWLWEIPAGRLGEEPTPLDTARAELAQEAGLAAARWDSLGAIRTSPGVFTEVVHLYMARDLTPTERAHEAGELIEVHWLGLEQAVNRALAGDLVDAKTVVALLRAAASIGCPVPRTPL